MASKDVLKNMHRIRYRIPIKGQKNKKDITKKTIDAEKATAIKSIADDIERAVDVGAPIESIDQWVQNGYLKPDQASYIFRNWTPPTVTKSADSVTYAKLSSAMHKHYELVSGAESKNYSTMSGKIGLVLEWIKENVSNLSEMDENTAREMAMYMETTAPQKKFELITRKDGKTIRKRKIGYAPKQVGSLCQTLHMAARLLHDGSCCDKHVRVQDLAGILQKNEVKNFTVTNPKRKTYPRPINNEESEWLMKHSQTEVSLLGGSFASSVHLGKWAGMRNEEATFCQWTHMELDHDIIEIQGDECPITGRWNGTKSGDSRKVDIHPDLKKVLLKERDRQIKLFGQRKNKQHIYPNYPYVIVGGGDGPVWSETLTEALKKFLKRHDQTTYTYYSLRHTFGTEYIRNGGNVKDLQLLMGHKDISTTMMYVDAVDVEKDRPIATVFG
jgi:integrase